MLISGENRSLRRITGFVIGLACLSSALGLIARPLPVSADDTVKRGEYLAHIMDCGGCHTPGALAGQPDFGQLLGGSDIGFHIPDLGIFYPPNLTPDASTGLGAWSVDDIVRAVRTGERPDGRVLAPIMPWRSYSHSTDEDARALAVYMKSLPPVQHKVPEPIGQPEDAEAPYLTVVVPE